MPLEWLEVHARYYTPHGIFNNNMHGVVRFAVKTPDFDRKQ